MFSKGCPYHIVTVNYLWSKAPPLESVLIVKEFPKVLPDDFPKIPHQWEIDLSIDLMSGTQPISIPPYQMDPADLKKLKAQVKDLLNKGFIQPTISP